VSGLLVLVTGTGRSGTSTIAGSLHHLGLYVPGPYLGANPSNPKGFFESRWAVTFHKAITRSARIDVFDSRPGAFARAAAAVTPEMRRQLVDFLRQVSAEAPQVVVKDPRSVWVQRLWREAAADAGLDIRYLTMLRHPAEVVGSRTTYYARRGRDGGASDYPTFNVARWVNHSLINERETRDQTRAFLPYPDLLEDWRSSVARLARELGLTVGSDLSDRSPHPVDEFVDPALRRHEVSWDGLGVPAGLRELAEEVWQQLVLLSRSGGVHDDASARLDRLGERYSRLFAEAVAVSHDAIEEAKDLARREGARNARRRTRRGGRRRPAANAAQPPGPAPGPAPGPEDRRLVDLTGRELLAAAGERALGRVRRTVRRTVRRRGARRG
jgi:hypothetical protein